MTTENTGYYGYASIANLSNIFLLLLLIYFLHVCTDCCCGWSSVISVFIIIPWHAKLNLISQRSYFISINPKQWSTSVNNTNIQQDQIKDQSTLHSFVNWCYYSIEVLFKIVCFFVILKLVFHGKQNFSCQTAKRNSLKHRQTWQGNCAEDANIITIP